MGGWGGGGDTVGVLIDGGTVGLLIGEFTAKIY